MAVGWPSLFFSFAFPPFSSLLGVLRCCGLVVFHSSAFGELELEGCDPVLSGCHSSAPPRQVVGARWVCGSAACD
ncbi:hypothetical protein CsSME_00029884 [Camellia sinensis var. sinensis]